MDGSKARVIDELVGTACTWIAAIGLAVVAIGKALQYMGVIN